MTQKNIFAELMSFQVFGFDGNAALKCRLISNLRSKSAGALPRSESFNKSRLAWMDSPWTQICGGFEDGM